MSSRQLPSVYLYLSILLLSFLSCQTADKPTSEPKVVIATPLIAVQDSAEHTIAIFREGEEKAIVTQHALRMAREN